MLDLNKIFSPEAENFVHRAVDGLNSESSK
jgi:hypothetical protein